MAKKQENVLIDGQVSIWEINKTIKKGNDKPVIKLENKENKNRQYGSNKNNSKI